MKKIKCPECETALIPGISKLFCPNCDYEEEVKPLVWRDNDEN